MPYQLTKTVALSPWTRIMVDNTNSVFSTGNIDRTYALAYDRFHTKAFAQAQLALSLRESGKSMAMIANRAGQLFRAARALKNLRFGDFSRELGLTSIRGAPRERLNAKWFKQSATKSLSDTWLEYTFGWVPLIQDIGQAIEVLQQDFKSRPVIGSATSFGTTTRPWDGGSEEASASLVKVRIRGTPVITNPNHLLAKQLGFTNPSLVIWDAIPFSFVVDWFVPVSKFLTSFDNEVGYEIKGRSKGVWADTWGFFHHIDGGLGGCSVRFFERSLPTSFPRPDLSSRMRVPELSPWLAATSVSLAVQQLSGFLSRK